MTFLKDSMSENISSDDDEKFRYRSRSRTVRWVNEGCSITGCGCMSFVAFALIAAIVMFIGNMLGLAG